MGLFGRKKRTNGVEVAISDWPAARTGIKVLLVDDDEDDRFLIADTLAAIADENYDVTCVGSYREAVATIRAGHYDVYLLDYYLGKNTGLDLLCNELDNGLKGPTILLTGVHDRDIDIKAMKHGASGFIDKTMIKPSELERAIRYAVEGHKAKMALVGGTPQPKRSRVISFLGVKGGVGTTTVVANIAVALARSQGRVVALDLRSHFGTLALQLGVEPREDLGDLLALGTEEINEESLHTRLTGHTSGARVLASPRRLDGYGLLGHEEAAAVLTAATESADVVLVDLADDPSEANGAIVRRSDIVVLVTDREPTSFAAAELTVQLVKAWGTDAVIGLVGIDRAVLPTPTSIDQVAASLGIESFAYIAAAKDKAREALASGIPVVMSSPSHFVTQAMLKLADALENWVPGDGPLGDDGSVDSGGRQRFRFFGAAE